MKNKIFYPLLLLSVVVVTFSYNAINSIPFEKKVVDLLHSEQQDSVKTSTLAVVKTDTLKSTVSSKTPAKSKTYRADIHQGIIGISTASEQEDAYDNVFHIRLDALPQANESAYLEYDLYGFDSPASIGRSLNNQTSIGGQFLSYNNTWTKQSELLDSNVLQKGNNVLLFTALKDPSHRYKIRNVRITYQVMTKEQTFVLYRTDHKFYIRGVCRASELKKLNIAGIQIDLSQPDFELILDKKELKDELIVTKELASGKVVVEKIGLKSFKKADAFVANDKAAKAVIKRLDPMQETRITNGLFTALFPKGALDKAIDISCTTLRGIDLAPLNSGMVNVTHRVSGYRLLPHGTVFNEEVNLGMAYDPDLIPEGYTTADVQVFYFDESARLWQAIPKESIDVVHGLIQAKTTHFTDFIAGIIQLPESPETSGNVPTSIKGLQAAHPLTGIGSIAAPSANNRGTASTGYAVEIPQGRGGMQPQVQIGYSSEQGHSWLGTGWDVALPSIGIETRWGTPRYDASYETESYVYAGESLLPDAHRSEWVTRSADKRFFPRSENSFQQIERKGSSPQTYYWIVKDKSGITSYYGANASGLSQNAVLQDAKGNIGHWALCYQVDLKGNSISYEYDKIEGELYIKKIYYTGSKSEKGNYSVTFLKNSDLGESNRKDIQVNARLGFKQVRNQLLRKIEVKYKDELIRGYELTYKEGAFSKTLLETISTLDSNGKLFYTNKLDYYDDVRDSNGIYTPFGPEIAWDVPNDNLKNRNIPPFTDQLFDADHTIVSSSEGDSKGVNYRLGVGLATNSGSLKGFTVGGHGGNSWGSSTTITTMIDIDGDGLADKVYKNGKKVYYRKNLLSEGKMGFGEARELNISDIGTSKSTSFNWGVDLNLKYGNIGYNEERSVNTTRVYFMDFNNDGLVDLVSNGVVYYNRLENGIPTFRNTSAGTPSPVAGGGNITIPGTSNIPLEEIESQNPLHDIVRVWVAPVKGIISVNHQFNLVEETDPEKINERKEYVTDKGVDKADGVRLFFQKDNQVLWKQAIGATDYSSKTKVDTKLAIEKGEKLYFRVSSIYDGNYDLVHWDPTITYEEIVTYEKGISKPIEKKETIAATAKDVNGYSLTTYRASKDFFTSSYRGVVVPVAGKVSFEGVLSKPITSDHVSLVITKQSLVNPNLPVVIVFEKQFLANEIVSFDLGTINLAAFEANSFVKVYLKTDSTIAWDSISFTPKIIVPSASTGTESIAIEVNHSLYGKRSGNYINKGITAPIKGKVNLDILEVDRELSTAKDSKYNGKVTLLAKQNNTLVGKKVYQLKAGKLEEEAVDNPTGIVYTQAQANEPIALEMVVENEKSLDLIRNYPTDKALPVQVHVVEVKEPEDTTPVARWNGDTTVFDIYTVLRADEIDLGVQHRGWGGFLINGNLAKEAIDQTRLVQPKSENSGIDLNDPNLENTNPDSLENTGMELSKAYFIGLTKQYSTATWRGLEEDIFIASSKMQASRLGENDLSVYTDFSLNEDTQAGGTTAMNIINENKSKSFALGGGASVGGASFGGGISKSIDGESFVTQAMGDFNGDGYPDYVRGKSVQVTLPVGKVSPTVIGLDQRFSHSSTESMGGSLGGSYSHGGTAKSLFSDVTPEYTSKKNPSKDAEKAGQSVSLSGNVGKGSDYATAVYMDINGDGLPDQVLKSGKVRLNTGYGFLEESDWHFDGLTSAKSSDWSAGMGYSVMNGSISGGMNYGRSESDSTTFFIDINGDGLVDRLNFSANNLYVEHNLGDRYDSPIVYPYSSSMNKNRSVSYGANTNVTVEFSVFLVRFAISVGGSLGWSTAKSEGCFLDIDGDGNLDYVVSKKDGHLVVKLSTIRRTNKLKSVHNAAGNSFEIDYEYIKPSYDRPSGVWALKSVDVFDGHKGDGIDHSIQKYAYENGYYNRREREFYGFGKVTSQQIDASDHSVFSTVVSTYHNKDYFRKGLLAEQVSFDKEGIKRAETTNAYSVFEAGTTQLVDVKELYSSASDSKGLFVGLVGVNQKTYEQDQSFLSTTLAYGYDRYGNIVSYSNSGNGTATDVVTAKIRYAESANPYFGAKATQIEVTTTDGLVRKREAVIDAKTAEVTQIKNYSSAQQVSITDLVYDNYGNLSKLTGPSNYRNQRMSLSYSYDSENNQYLTQIKDGFGYQNTTVYDYRFGVPVSSTDRNDQRTVYAYDTKGRLSSLTGPYELAANKPYTIAYEYYPEATVPYAKMRNYDPAHQADIETYTYSDGLGRAIQVKKTGSLFTQKGSADQLVHLVSGKTVYDGLGRVAQTYEPTSATVLDNTFSTAVSDAKPTEVTYDAVSRPVKVVLPDGSTQSTSFAIGRYGDVSVLMTKQTDALNNTREVHTDSKGLTVLSKHNDLETKFVYNALGENLSVIDAQDKASKSSYNWLGQRMSYTHPDAGTTTYTYDLAGNLTHRVTQAIQDLFGKEGAITYSY
ncbi:MAG: hypothetical protein LBE34_10315, partial [Flavobacteriaceae bacterium]|nr:hypothetical protein [Flavobacteriaceae bacterium]